MMVPAGKPIPAEAGLIILPGSKSTIADLKHLRRQGWDIDIQAHYRQGKAVLGICGGYQMLGRMIHDPEGIEGPPESVSGLGLLQVETTLSPQKRLRLSQAQHIASGETISGYEIHLGATAGDDCTRPFSMNNGRPDGAISKDGLIMGTYVHGGFSADGFRSAFLKSLGGKTSALSFSHRIEETLDNLAAHLDAHLDLDGILSVSSEVAL